MTLSKDKCGQRRLPNANPEEEEGQLAQGQGRRHKNWERSQPKAVALLKARSRPFECDRAPPSLFNSARKLAAPHLQLQSPACGLWRTSGQVWLALANAPRVICRQFLASGCLPRSVQVVASICSRCVKIRFLWELLVEAPPAGKCFRFAERIWIVLMPFLPNLRSFFLKGNLRSNCFSSNRSLLSRCCRFLVWGAELMKQLNGSSEFSQQTG